MPRGGRGSGRGGRSSLRAPRATKPAPAPAVQSPGNNGGSVIGTLGSAVVDGWGWGAGVAMAQRAMDRIIGPRTFQIDHTTNQQPLPPPAGAAPSSACDFHNMAFQDCINHNGSDISKCQFYIDVLND